MFDFILNDENELMLLIYAQEGEPCDAFIQLNLKNKTGLLQRSPASSVITLYLNDVGVEIMDALCELDTILVTELSMEKEEEDTQIIRVYEASVIRL